MPEDSAWSAIDVHGHYGTYPSTHGRCHQRMGEFRSADAAAVSARAARSGIGWTVVSPLSALMPRGRADAPAGNREACAVVPQTPGLLQWVVVDPTVPGTFEQARQMLALPHVVGIKIHPEEHVYPITKFGGVIFEFAAEHKAVVLAHSGDVNSKPEDFLPFADAHAEVRLILAHLGSNCDGDPAHQVRVIERARHANVFTDTSSAQSLSPGLIEFAVREVGARFILFGTDTPLYHSAMQRARIDAAEMSDEERALILRGNATRLLAIPATGSGREQANASCIQQVQEVDGGHSIPQR